MNREAALVADGTAQMKIEDYLDPEGNIAIPDGVTLTSFLDRNVAELGATPAYRYLDFDRDRTLELTWTQLGTRLRAVGARLQQVTQPGDRVAVLTPQGVDYVVAFFAAIQAGTIAVPLFAPELPGHAERLDAVLGDARATPSADLSAQGGLTIEDYALIDLRAGLSFGDKRYKISAFVRNLGNTYYWSNATRITDTTVRFAGRPRTFGASLSARF